MKKPVNIGVVGAGASARFHVEALQSMAGVVIKGIADCQHDKARALSTSMHIPYYTDQVDELMDSSEIDALVIAVPPTFQPKLAIKAFEKGKHVLCEKPLALNHQEAGQILAAAKKSGRVGMINFCYRLIPQIQAWRARLKAGDCGRVHSIHVEWILSNRLNPSLTHHWKGQKEEGGGVLQNYGTHVLDYLFYDIATVKLLGANQSTFIPTRQDEEGNNRPVTGDEVVTALFEIDGGTAVIIHLSLVSSPAFGHKIIARGSKGTLEVSNDDPQSPSGPFSLWFYKDNAQKGQCLSKGDPLEHGNMAKMFARVSQRFVEAIQDRRQADNPWIESGVKTNLLINQIQNFQ